MLNINDYDCLQVRIFGLKIPSAAGMAADLRDERKAEV